MTWCWLKEGVILAVHDEQIAEHGGRHGIRDMGLVSSALMRPQHLAAYENPSVFDLAAAYAFGIIKNHPFVDGNKRTGFSRRLYFPCLEWMGIEVASEVDAVTVVLALAEGKIEEALFSEWLRVNSVTLPKH